MLLCVKSAATSDAAQLAAALLPGAPVLSLQNGIGNAGVAQQAAPGLRVLPGMVPYSVAELAPGAWHRGTAGALAAPRDAALAPWCRCSRPPACRWRWCRTSWPCNGASC